MFRPLLSASAMFALLLASFTFSARTQACPIKEPETLLALYKNSEEIHIARFAKAIDVSIQSDDENYTAVSVKNHFDISSTLKGESRKMFATDDIDYRYKKNAEAVEEPQEEEEADDEERLKPGDLVLLFLKYEIEESEGEEKTEKDTAKAELVLTDSRDGIRHIDDDELSVYEARLKELNAIFAEGKASDSRIVEWLIDCIEYPATRWDGAYELDESLSSLARVQSAEESKKEPKTGDEEPEWVSDSDPDKAKYARLLTDQHKRRITNILTTPDVSKSEEKDARSNSLSSGDYALIELVTRWADAEVAGYLLQRLRNGVSDRYESAALMGAISTALDDKDVTAALEGFRDALYEEDEALVEDDEPETQDVTTNEDGVLVPTTELGKEVPAPKTKGKTYLELRTEMLARFIGAADAALSRTQEEKTAKELNSEAEITENY